MPRSNCRRTASSTSGSRYAYNWHEAANKVDKLVSIDVPYAANVTMCQKKRGTPAGELDMASAKGLRSQRHGPQRACERPLGFVKRRRFARTFDFQRLVIAGISLVGGINLS